MIKTNSDNFITIVCFGALGDILNSTPIVRHYKTKGNFIRYITSETYSKALENNSDIDKLVCLSNISSNHVSETKIRRGELLSRYGGEKKVIFSAPYASKKYDGTPRSNLLRIIKEECSLVGDDEWECDFMPYITLSDEQKKEANGFFNALPPGKNILVEWEFKSGQSYLEEKLLKKVVKEIKVKANIIFTSLNKPPFYEDFIESFPKQNFFHYGGSFLSNAELYNLCDYFISTSSGVCCLTSSDYCLKSTTMRAEFPIGEHWSSLEWSHNNHLKTIVFANNFQQLIYKVLDEVNNG